MKLDIQGLTHGSSRLEQFQTDWIGLTIEENSMIFNFAQISSAQLLVINVFCGNGVAYEKADDLTIATLGPAQAELEALFRARGRALAMFFQDSTKQ